MPSVDFRITGVDAVARGLTPLLHFKLLIETIPAAQRLEGLLLSAQIQLQCPLRTYAASEKEKLTELFGAPEHWGRTLRNKLWTHAQATVGPFTGSCETVLPIACSYDLNLAPVKFLYALDGGDVSLLFLFSGSVFYLGQEGRLQVERVSWNKECTYRFPVQVWQSLMEQHYPNSAWVTMRRDLFDRLYAYRRRKGLATWDQALEQLLAREVEGPPAIPSREGIAA